jgi:hypothetical protein
MLFTDDDLLTAADLVALDSEVTEVAAAEDLVVEGEGSILRQAWEECANEVLGRMEAFGGELVFAGGGRWGALGGTRSRVYLTQIVATDAYARKLSALQRWVLYRALVLFYRAATNRTVNDRHALKMAQFAEDAKQHWKALWRRGLPVVLEPLPCPGALHEWNAGAWDGTKVTGVAGGASAETTYTLAITWVDGSRYQSPTAKGNAESAGSRVLAYTLPANELLQVSIAGLRPPDGTPAARTPADGAFRTLVATAWNVYVGAAEGPLYLQNPAPVPIGTSSYTLAAAPVLGGAVLDPGQVPDTNFTFQNTLQRG